MVKAQSSKRRSRRRGRCSCPRRSGRSVAGAGRELIVEERPEGVLLRPAPKTAATMFEDVRGSLGRVDRVVSIEEMIKPATRRRDADRRAVDDRN